MTPRVLLVEQELLILLYHLSSSPVFSGVHVTWSLFLCDCVCFEDHCMSFWPIVLSVLLRFMDSDYPFGIFKLFLTFNCKEVVRFIICRTSHKVHSFMIYVFFCLSGRVQIIVSLKLMNTTKIMVLMCVVSWLRLGGIIRYWEV